MPVETVPNSGHPLSAIDDATIQQIETAILEDRRVTEREVVNEVKISLVSVEKIIYNHMHMWRVSAWWIPRLLTPLQKEERAKCAKSFSTMHQDNQTDLCDTLIMGSSLWSGDKSSV